MKLFRRRRTTEPTEAITHHDGNGSGQAERPTHHDPKRLRVVVDHDVCFYCGACVAVCPPDSIFLENHNLKIDDDTCTRCDRCTGMCPVHALSMVEMVAESELRA